MFPFSLTQSLIFNEWPSENGSGDKNETDLVTQEGLGLG
jgi:hypothetical protein